MTEFLSAPTPFIMGVVRGVDENIASSTRFQELDTDVLIVDIDNDRLYHPRTPDARFTDASKVRCITPTYVSIESECEDPLNASRSSEFTIDCTLGEVDFIS